MVYFTADLHFGHENIIRYCQRPFANTAEMDRSLIDSWNRRVRENDEVYILGDLFYRNDRHPSEYLKALRGRKYLILGNHDVKWLRGMDLSDYFTGVSRMEERLVDGRPMTLCHYPLMTWAGCARGAYMIHGHIHNSTGMAYWPLLQTMEAALNAGVDVNGFEPVTLEELVANNRIQKERPYEPSDSAVDQ